LASLGESAFRDHGRPDTDGAMRPEAELLKEVPLFELLDDHERAELAGQLDEVHFGAGEIIFNYGDPGDAIYV
jgi:hypothetical protein